MERIKQALEKARQDRLMSGGAAVLATPRGAAAPADQIQYTQTRSQDVALSHLREQRIVSAFEPGVYTDAFRILRTQILQRLVESRWNSLAITSAEESEGKTLTAINLAISLAREVTHTVLLVEADLRHPSVHRHFDIPAPKGLSDYLTGDVPLSELLINPAGIPRFVVLPGGQALANSAEMLNSPKMVRLVEELKSRYRSRIVLFDLPPILSCADTLAFSPYVDAALLVIEEGRSRAADIRRAAELLKGTHFIGTVLNKSREKTAEGMRSAELGKRLQDLIASLNIGALGRRIRTVAGKWLGRLKRKP